MRAKPPFGAAQHDGIFYPSPDLTPRDLGQDADGLLGFAEVLQWARAVSFIRPKSPGGSK